MPSPWARRMPGSHNEASRAGLLPGVRSKGPVSRWMHHFVWRICQVLNHGRATDFGGVGTVAPQDHIVGLAAACIDRIVAGSAVQNRWPHDVSRLGLHLERLQLDGIGPGLGVDEKLIGDREGPLAHAVDRDCRGASRAAGLDQDGIRAERSTDDQGTALPLGRTDVDETRDRGTRATVSLSVTVISTVKEPAAVKR